MFGRQGISSELKESAREKLALIGSASRRQIPGPRKEADPGNRPARIAATPALETAPMERRGTVRTAAATLPYRPFLLIDGRSEGCRDPVDRRQSPLPIRHAK